MNYFSHQQRVTKPVLKSKYGIVSSQNRRASEVGAKVLASGGNAIDAAIATSFALGILEPWMSGCGGGGFMILKMKNQQPQVIDFGMRSPKSLNPNNYPIINNCLSNGLFPWKKVLDGRNEQGATSIAVPGQVKGMWLAWQKYGTQAWSELLHPAIQLAKSGLVIDWYAQLIIAASAKDIQAFETTKSMYFDAQSGFPKSSSWVANQPEICQFDALSKTLTILARNGGDAFYTGQLAEKIVTEINANGGCFTLDDLESYQAKIYPAGQFQHHNGNLYYTPQNSGGTAYQRFFELLFSMDDLHTGDACLQDADYLTYAKALQRCYQERLDAFGNEECTEKGTCTTSFSVVDREGNMVSCTQTLVSIFGSKLTLSQTGLLMNNGIIWFDPESGKSNSLTADQPCLANMCPVIGERADGLLFAMGAAGGRKIIPAVCQLSSFLMDFNLSLEDAFHTPRIDLSNLNAPVLVDCDLAQNIRQLIAQYFQTQEVNRSVYPYHFACPSAVAMQGSNREGASEIMSFWSDSVSEELFL